MLNSKIKLSLIFLTIFLLLLPAFNLFAQDDNYDDYSAAEDDTPLGSIKMGFFGLGYGQYNMSGQIGFRYDFDESPVGVGFMGGMAGFNNNLPAHLNQTLVNPLRTQWYPETHTKLVITFDGMFFYSFKKKFTGFFNLGIYTKQDSTFAVTYDDFNYPTRYLYSSQTHFGITAGAGFDYLVYDQLAFGAGYHSEQGFYIKLGYYWR